MKKSELRQIIKEELQKSSKKLLTEGTPGIDFAKKWAEEQKIKKAAKTIKEDLLNEASKTIPTAIKYLEKSVGTVLKAEGIKVSAKDLSTIAAEWLYSTVEADYVTETLPDDLYDNTVINNIVTDQLN